MPLLRLIFILSYLVFSGSSSAITLSSSEQEGVKALKHEGEILYRLLRLQSKEKFKAPRCDNEQYFEEDFKTFFRKAKFAANGGNANSVQKYRQLASKLALSLLSSFAKEAKVAGEEKLEIVREANKSYIDYINLVLKDEITNSLQEGLVKQLQKLSEVTDIALATAFYVECTRSVEFLSEKSDKKGTLSTSDLETPSLGFALYSHFPLGKLIQALLRIFMLEEDIFRCLPLDVQKFAISLFRNIYFDALKYADQPGVIKQLQESKHTLNEKWDREAKMLIAKLIDALPDLLYKKFQIPHLFGLAEIYYHVSVLSERYQKQLDGKYTNQLNQYIQNKIKRSNPFYILRADAESKIVIAGKKIHVFPEPKNVSLIVPNANSGTKQYRIRYEILSQILVEIKRRFGNEIPNIEVQLSRQLWYMARSLYQRNILVRYSEGRDLIYSLQYMAFRMKHPTTGRPAIVGQSGTTPKLKPFERKTEIKPPSKEKPYVNAWTDFVNNALKEKFEKFKYRGAEELLPSIDSLFLQDFQALTDTKKDYIAERLKKEKYAGSNFYGKNKTAKDFFVFDFEDSIKPVFAAMIQKLKSSVNFSQAKQSDVESIIKTQFENEKIKIFLLEEFRLE